MEIRLLGPIEAVSESGAVQLGARKQRALLARLALDPNRTLPLERLVDDLWGDDVPATAAKMVQVHVSQLRKVLPAGLIETRPPGYAIVLEPDATDLFRFERLRDEGRIALNAGDARTAAGRFRQALALWRGQALVEFQEPFALREGARLEELRISCLEDRIEADLAVAPSSDLVGELDALVERDPLREAPRRQLILALYRTGRHAEALAAYQAFRRLLADELGIEPSHELRELELRVLRQDSDLDLQSRSGRPSTVSPPASRPAAVEHRYVNSGDVSIAYQVVGEGPPDLVLVHGWVCTFQPGWERPQIADFYRRLAQMGRLVMFDKRGTGLSDRVHGIAPLEERMDDVRAVMDAVGSERAVLLGISDGGSMVALFAATYPERTAAVIAMGTFARRLWAPDYAIGFHAGSELGSQVPRPQDWGRPIAETFLEQRAPSLVGDQEAIDWYASYITRGASPGAAGQMAMMNQEIDVRHVLPSIRAPTLVTYRAGEYLREATRYMAARIPQARIVELEGADHLPWEGDADALLEQIDRFLSDLGDAAEPDRAPTTASLAGAEAADLDRVLATVLFTDIVGSAELAVRLGDSGWRDVVEKHHSTVRALLARYRGREIDTTGDGFFAIFDGPARAVRCAAAAVEAVKPLGIEIRAGVHTGEVETISGKTGGLTVMFGSRVGSIAGASEVLVSHTVKDLVAGSGLTFDDRGDHSLKGIPGEWRLYSVARLEGAQHPVTTHV